MNSKIKMIEEGRKEAKAGWFQYGAAMNQARELFDSETEFERWVEANGLDHTGEKPVTIEERAAAMWAAANPTDFDRAERASGAETVRGVHAHWKQFRSIEGLLKS